MIEAVMLHATTKPEAGQIQLGLWDAVATDDAWQVRESARARRLAARVFPDGRVEIVVPHGTGAGAVKRFVNQHREWIERTRHRVVKAQPALLLAAEWPPAELQLTALDEVWECRRQSIEAASAAAEVLVVQNPIGQRGVLLLRAALGDTHGARAALLEWLRARAAQRLLPPLRLLATEMNCDFWRLQIRLQRSRWGSCSRQGAVSLNCCLLFQRPEVVRYLLVHELAHRRHMNHGPAFWALVADHEPAWRELDRELARGWRRAPHWMLAKMLRLTQ